MTRNVRATVRDVIAHAGRRIGVGDRDRAHLRMRFECARRLRVTSIARVQSVADAMHDHAVRLGESGPHLAELAVAADGDLVAGEKKLQIAASSAPRPVVCTGSIGVRRAEDRLA